MGKNRHFEQAKSEILGRGYKFVEFKTVWDSGGRAKWLKQRKSLPPKKCLLQEFPPKKKIESHSSAPTLAAYAANCPPKVEPQRKEPPDRPLTEHEQWGDSEPSTSYDDPRDPVLAVIAIVLGVCVPWLYYEAFGIYPIFF